MFWGGENSDVCVCAGPLRKTKHLLQAQDAVCLSRSQQTSGGENIEISACNSLGPQAKGSNTLLGRAEL